MNQHLQCSLYQFSEKFNFSCGRGRKKASNFSSVKVFSEKKHTQKHSLPGRKTSWKNWPNLPCDTKKGTLNSPDRMHILSLGRVSPSNGNLPQTKTYSTTPMLWKRKKDMGPHNTSWSTYHRLTRVGSPSHVTNLIRGVHSHQMRAGSLYGFNALSAKDRCLHNEEDLLIRLRGCPVIHNQVRLHSSLYNYQTSFFFLRFSFHMKQWTLLECHQTHPNVYHRRIVLFAFKQLWRSIRWAATPCGQQRPWLEVVAETKICKKRNKQKRISWHT